MRYWVSAALAFALSACGWSDPPLPTHGVVPEFVLTSHTGEDFSSRELAGKVWVADFIFTNCMGPCPRMTSQMRSVQEAFASEPDVRFVSFTVDPKRDTPEVLTAYARRHKANLDRWFFLTGPVEKLHELKRNVFLLGDVDGVTFEHSTRFVLVDAQSRIRGFYTSSEAGDIDMLKADMRKLIRERS